MILSANTEYIKVTIFLLPNILEDRDKEWLWNYKLLVILCVPGLSGKKIFILEMVYALGYFTHTTMVI